MDKQPKGQSPVEALRLAELKAMHERGTIRRGHIDEMLTELRRLYALNQKLGEENSKLWGWYHDAEQQIAVLQGRVKAKEQT